MPSCTFVPKLPVMLQYNWLAVGQLSLHCLHVNARCLWSYHHFNAVRMYKLYRLVYYVAPASLNDCARMHFSCLCFGLLLPVLLLVLLRCHEVWVTIASPGESVAIQTQKLTLPFFLLPAPA